MARQREHRNRKPQIPLSQLELGATGRIIELTFPQPQRRRFVEMGFLEGNTVQAIRRAPFGDPTQYKIFETFLAIRKKDADHVLVHVCDNKNKNTEGEKKPMTPKERKQQRTRRQIANRRNRYGFKRRRQGK